MFTTDSSSNRKQFLSFIFSLWLQVTLILLLTFVSSRVSHAKPTFKHPEMSQQTPVYFEPPPLDAQVATAPRDMSKPAPDPKNAGGLNLPAAKKKAEPQKAEPKVEEAAVKAPEPKPEPEKEAADPTPNPDDTPAPMTDYGMMSGMPHRYTPAQPIYTPDPPVLHENTPEVAKGKDLVIKLDINDQGTIVGFSVVQGIGHGVETMIIDTLRQWTFVPAKFNGMPIATRLEVSFHFPG